ncbi:MAG: hypothetical protein HETSPECPRED_007079 [Heterodermia speciosa]|uniref:Uncharacterized protein n=1 Tax=Heterodermia speciosa TaxID=116794 RepID=A0A8H3EK19_9LECA|nr:MAG: hypothetical protein HETSPECPRED_007079 [Heterodermia speciosa]
MPFGIDITLYSPAVAITMDTAVQPPVTCNIKGSITKLETSQFAINGMTMTENMLAIAWKRSRGSLRYPVSCSEYHPYLNPDPSIDPDRDVETTDAPAANAVPTTTHGKRKRSGEGYHKKLKRSKSKHAKSVKNQNNDVQTWQPASKGSIGSKKVKNDRPPTSRRKRTAKNSRRVPKYDGLLDHKRDPALMDTFGTLGGEMMAETYGYELASRMDPASWDYNFF